MTTLEIQEDLLEASRARYEEYRLRDLEGKQIAKGVKFGHELIQRTPVLDDPSRYLELLRQLLAEEVSRVRGSAEDDPDGRVLWGMQTVMKDIEQKACEQPGAAPV